MIVGLGFNKEVGKDTAAEALGKELGFKRLAFADKLKELALEANPLVTTSSRTVNVQVGHGRMYHVVTGLGGWDEAKRIYPEVRKFLQDLGLAARKVFGETFWIDQVMGEAQRREAAGLNTVITDVRYLNEAETVRAAGGLLIRITRPGKNGDGHPSETELADYDGWDAVIENNRSIVDLQAEVVQFVRDRMPKPETPAFLKDPHFMKDVD